MVVSENYLPVVALNDSGSAIDSQVLARYERSGAAAAEHAGLDRLTEFD